MHKFDFHHGYSKYQRNAEVIILQSQRVIELVLLNIGTTYVDVQYNTFTQDVFLEGMKNDW